MGCTKLKNIIWNPETFSTISSNTFGRMFTDCKSLEYVDVSMFDTRNVSNMFMMFSGCESLSYIDTHNWDIRNVEKHKDMFNGATVIGQIYGVDGENILFP